MRWNAGNGEERHHVTPDELCLLAGSVKPLVLVKHVTAPFETRCQLFLLRPFACPFFRHFLPTTTAKSRNYSCFRERSKHLVQRDTFRKRDKCPSFRIGRSNCFSEQMYMRVRNRDKNYITKYARIILIYDTLEDNDPSSIMKILQRYKGRRDRWQNENNI